MSHLVKMSSANIVDPEAFIKACAELGLTEVRRNVEIMSYYKETILADVAIRCGTYDLALVKNQSGKYDVVADWYGVASTLQSMGKDKLIGGDPKKSILATYTAHHWTVDENLQNFLVRHTTKHTIVNKYRRLGFRADVREDDNKNLTVTLQRA